MYSVKSLLARLPHVLELARNVRLLAARGDFLQYDDSIHIDYISLTCMITNVVMTKMANNLKGQLGLAITRSAMPL